MSLERAFWVYPWDLVDEGLPRALDRMRDRAGATAVNVATIYHSGKFLHVHNPNRKVVFPRSGTLYFTPDRSWHGKLRLEPPVWSGVESGEEFWSLLRTAADDRQLTVTAWVVSLHNSGLGFAYPDCSVENPFGDPIVTDLCPRHPDVREYLVAAVGDIVRHLPVDRILLESLEYMPFLHGFHHEVVGVPTGPMINFLMSLCFCSHCRMTAGEEGFDFEGVRDWVRSVLEGHFADPFSGTPEMSWEELRAQVDGAFGTFLRLRQTTLVSLLEEIATEVRRAGSVRLALGDFGPLYQNGPDGRAWENGVDLAQQLPLVDEIHPTFYFTDPRVHREKVTQYLEMLGGERPMYPAIRAILPQTASFDDLWTQLEPLARHVAGFSFYNYGFMALSTLDWIVKAMARLEDMIGKGGSDG